MKIEWYIIVRCICMTNSVLVVMQEQVLSMLKLIKLLSVEWMKLSAILH